MARAAIFIDGGYLRRILTDHFNRARVDYSLLSQEMAGNTDILRTYYYDCLPYQSDPPTLAEKRRFSKTEGFFATLRRLPRYEVRLGKLEYRGRNPQTGRPSFAQKRVDALMGIDLALLSAQRSIADAVILTGDSDFLPAVEVAKSQGVLVRLYYHRSSCHNDLLDAMDERVEITQALIVKLRL